MELLRYGRDAWGQEVLEGVSYALTGWFAGATLAIIVVHLAYRWLRPPRA